MIPFETTCYYCNAPLIAMEVFVECKACENHPCYINGFAALSFNNIFIEDERYAITYVPETGVTELLIFKPKGTKNIWKTLSSMKVSQPITPTNVVKFVEHCLKMKAFL